MSLDDIVAAIASFRDEREWKQFHKPQQLAAAIAIEAAELQEHFLWKTEDEVVQVLEEQQERSAVGEEIADVLIYSLLLAHDLQLNIAETIQAKLAVNAQRYPVESSRGIARKAPQSRSEP